MAVLDQAMRGTTPLLLVSLLAPVLAGAASQPRLDVVLQVEDTAGRPLPATIDLGGALLRTDGQGGLKLPRLRGPAVALVSAAGHLTEPVPLGWADAGQVRVVRLYGVREARRWVMHSGGDVVLGRRFSAALSQQDAGGRRAERAGELLAPLSRVFAAADLSTVNFESVTGLPRQAPGHARKRYLLDTPADLLGALRTMGVDLAVLANNHVRDFLDAGVAATLAALDAAEISHCGAGLDEASAAAPFVTTIRGVRVGVLAWTLLDGAAVNERLPGDAEPVPADLPAKRSWLYEKRPWSFRGASWSVAADARRAGAAWRLFAGAQPGLSEEERAAAWSSLSAVYPELQELVARHGHGGAAFWQLPGSARRIRELAGQVELVVVQLHGGHEYHQAPAQQMRAAARAAIDAGAGIVIGHHPHVLQGLEWYRGRLIAYSLGNLVFDQEGLSTFGTAVLRTVWDGARLLEARLLPLERVGLGVYPATDGAARRILARVWERSLLGAEIVQVPGQDPRGRRLVPLALPGPLPDTSPVGLVLEGHTARITAGDLRGEQVLLAVEPGRNAALPPAAGLVHPRPAWAAGSSGGAAEAEATLQVGQDLFGWGSFEDELADGREAGDAHWLLGTGASVRVGDAATGRGFLRLETTAGAGRGEPVLARPVARIALPRPRSYALQGETLIPLEPPVAAYSLEGRARFAGAGRAALVLEVYRVPADVPGEAPASVLAGRQELPLPLVSGTAWQDLGIPLDGLLPGPESGASRGEERRAVLFTLRLQPDGSGAAGRLDVDDLRLVAWRPAARMPSVPGAYGWVRDTGGGGRRSLGWTVFSATR